MNKVITINLGGTPFTIDEDAYEHLKKYLNTIHGHFRHTEGYEDITSDIEARMAELFQERLGSRPIVHLKDVQAVIGIMGRPEEFGAEPLDDGPEADGPTTTFRTGKRLFRHPDDVQVGGVCAGLAAYFGIADPVWVRLLFVVIALSGGFGVPIYFVLWAIVPKATTSSDFLAMRGEPINVASIVKTVQDGVQHFTEKMSELEKEFDPKKKSPTETTNSADPVGIALQPGLSAVARVLLVTLELLLRVWRPVLVAIGAVILTAFALSWVGTILGLVLGWSWLAFLLPAKPVFLAPLFMVSLLIVVGIPLMRLGLLVARLAFGGPPRHAMPRYWRPVLNGLLIAGVVGLFVVGNFLAREFSHKTTVDVGPTFMTEDTDTLVVKLEPLHYGHTRFDSDHFIFADKHLFVEDVDLEVVKADSGGAFVVHHTQRARGYGTKSAAENALHAEYGLFHKPGELRLHPAYSLAPGNPWRQQEVRLRLEIPVGKSLRVEDNARQFIRKIPVEERRTWYRQANEVWTMTEEGLRCLSCPAQE